MTQPILATLGFLLLALLPTATAQPYPRIVGDAHLVLHLDFDAPLADDGVAEAVTEDQADTAVGGGFGVGGRLEYALGARLTTLVSVDYNNFGAQEVGRYIDLSGTTITVRPSEDIRVDRKALSVLVGARVYAGGSGGTQPFVAVHAGVERTGLLYTEYSGGDRVREIQEVTNLGLAVMPEVGARFRYGLLSLDGAVGYQLLGEGKRLSVHAGVAIPVRSWGRRIGS